MPREKTYTEECDEIAKQYGIEFAVAMDIHILRDYEARIVAAAKADPSLRDFPVENVELWKFLREHKA